MNHNTLPGPGQPEVASDEELAVLRDRIGSFVDTRGPRVIFPEGTPMYDSGREPPRPVIAHDAESPTVYLTFSGEFLAGLAPDIADAVQRLAISELSLLNDTPTYHFVDNGPVPSEPGAITEDDIADKYWMTGGSGIFIKKTPDAECISTLYRLCASGAAYIHPEPHEDSAWSFLRDDTLPVPVPLQELTDFNTLLDELDKVPPEVLAQVVVTEVSSMY
ncbi:MAG TPA: hypothetical protein VIR03_01795 [Candidatus Saccharimonadales bacterium]